MALSILENLKCALPSEPVPDGVDSESVLADFEATLGSLNASDFSSQALWRDMFALTGSIRTFYGADEITSTWKFIKTSAVPKNFIYRKKSSRVVRLRGTSWIEGSFSFDIEETPARLCNAILSLVPGNDGKWRIWVLRTFVDSLVGHPSPDQLTPVGMSNGMSNGISNGISNGMSNGMANGASNGVSNGGMSNGMSNGIHHSEHDENQRVFECVVVGGGQAGLGVAGRLQSQGIDYVLLEKNVSIGDSWGNRYRSTKLHTTRESSHLPFNRTFPARYPEYLTKDHLSEGYQEWVREYGINFWVSTNVISGEWHDDKKNWTLVIQKGNERRIITTTYLVLASGAGCQIPTMPTYPGIESFRGKIQHSVNYTHADGWQGKHGIVVGTANTAHDVAEDMVAADLASVTMVQRSSTYVLPAEYYAKVQDMSYNADIPIEAADQTLLTTPLGISRLVSMLVLNGMAKAEPERFDALEKAGFKLNRYGDIIYQVFDRFGGHYMDVGASKKIANGLIKMKSDALPVRYTEDGLVFDDGTELKADVVVFATGFVGSMKDGIRDMLGSQVADRVDDFWGINEEGEIKGAYRPSGHPHFWMAGGPNSYTRYMSRYIALQIRAELDGTPLPVLG